ncbi:MAG: hypothetical protein R3321_12885 [Nitrososphaeraceae archaeon]|nr:hypothetical protein [Nitrososphaeraceae archaeon]
MIKILGTTRQSYFSKLIRKVTKGQISHIAIEIFGLIVVQSNLRGFNIRSSAYFREHNDIIIELIPTFIVKKQEIIDRFDFITRKYEDSWYDFGAFMFQGIALTLRNIFKIPLPKSNLWQSTGMFLCYELVSKIIKKKENPMLTPDKYLEELIKSGGWRKI